MKGILKNVLKAAITMFAIGALLGVAVPAIADLLGAGVLGKAAFDSLTNTPVIQTGIFFSAFGAISAVITPTVNFLFGDRAEKTVTSKAIGVHPKELGYEQGLEPSSAITHDPSAAAHIAQNSSHFQEMVATSKAAGPNTNQIS